MKYFEIIKLKEIPVICNIPHGSINIPSKFKKDFIISDQELEIEAKKLGDLYAELLFSGLLAEYGGIISKVSRIVVDTERFEDDEKETMSKVGMGAIYTKNENGEVIRKTDKESQQSLISEIYQPYHLALADLIGDCLSKFGKCLILDCHTFPSKPRSYEFDKSKNRPDICLGTDKFHTPENLKMVFSEKFKKSSFSVKYDNPFSGTMAPKEYYRKNKNISSIMIEVNRKLYMDEEKFSRNTNFDAVSDKICTIIKEACNSFYAK
jgi:N-formylglutamate amidohydrolase